MPKITEGQYALGALTIFAVWVFVVLPLVSAYQAAQFARPPEYAQPNKQSSEPGNASHNESEPRKSFRERMTFIWERTTEDPTAFFTAWVAIFTFVLAASTIALWLVTWRSGIKQSRDMRRSIEISEKALIDLEAPFISIKIIEPGIQWNQAARAVTGGNLRFTYGRTPATIFEAFEDFHLVNPGDGLPPPINARNERGPPMPWGVIAPPNGGESQPFAFNVFASVLREAGRDPNTLRNGIPFFLGFVMFGDIFDNLYTLGFCFLFDRMTGRFILAGREEYNYCRKERGPYVPPGANRAAPPPPLAFPPSESDDGELATS